MGVGKTIRGSKMMCHLIFRWRIAPVGPRSSITDFFHKFAPLHASFGYILIASALEMMKNARTDYRFTSIILWKASVILYCINDHFWPCTERRITNFSPFWLSFRLQSINCLSLVTHLLAQSMTLESYVKHPIHNTPSQRCQKRQEP